MLVIISPWVLLNPKNIRDFLFYYLSFVPGFIYGMYLILAHWLLPSSSCGESMEQRKVCMNYVEKQLKERKITWDVEREDSYECVMA